MCDHLSSGRIARGDTFLVSLKKQGKCHRCCFERQKEHSKSDTFSSQIVVCIVCVRKRDHLISVRLVYFVGSMVFFLPLDMSISHLIFYIYTFSWCVRVWVAIIQVSWSFFSVVLVYCVRPDIPCSLLRAFKFNKRESSVNSVRDFKQNHDKTKSNRRNKDEWQSIWLLTKENWNIVNNMFG